MCALDVYLKTRSRFLQRWHRASTLFGSFTTKTHKLAKVAFVVTDGVPFSPFPLFKAAVDYSQLSIPRPTEMAKVAFVVTAGVPFSPFPLLKAGVNYC